MKVGVIQSNYLPWRGYFDFIDEVDLFVVHDDLQFTKGDWRNRNRIKTAQGMRWITVPVHHRHTAQLIGETEIDYSRNWQREHRNVITTSLVRAPYLRDVLGLLDPHYDARHLTISDLNVALLKSICGYLGIRTPLLMSSEFELTKTRTERLIELLTKMGATTYVSGPTGRGYLEEERFRDTGIQLEYKRYDYADYPQFWGAFDGAVSIVDTIAHCGPAARDVLTSGKRIEQAAA